MKYISVQGTAIYGVNANNDIFYRSNWKIGDWIKIDGKLKQVQFYGNRVCGVNCNHDIYCKDNLNLSNWYQIDGKLKHVTIYDQILYGIVAKIKFIITIITMINTKIIFTISNIDRI